MAKRQKQLNKNLVAGLTIATMVATVAIVAVVTVNAARRDPADIAKKASALEAEGKLQDAAQLFMRAYGEQKQAEYLVDAARCAYDMGEIGLAIGTLRNAHAQEPDNIEVLNAILDRYWGLRRQTAAWQDMKDYAEAALELQPDNLLALVSRAMALEAMQQQDPTYADQAAAALARAVELDKNDPRVVELRVRKLVADASKEAQMQVAAGHQDKAQQALEKVRDQAAEIFKAAIAEHPKATLLYINFAQTLIDSKRYEEAEKVFNDAVAELPDDEKIQYSLAAYHQGRASALLTDNPEEAKRHVKAGLDAVARTIEIEPATYDAYNLRATLTQLEATLDGKWASDQLAQQAQILDALESALADTVGLRSVAAVTGREARARLIAGSFDRAYGYYQAARDDNDARDKLLPYVESFRQRARDEYGESVMVPLIDGQYAILKGDTRGAIQAFSDAEDKAGAFGSRYELLAKQQLARLYTQDEENGVALKYTEATLQWYADHHQDAPLEMWINRANLLTRLDRAQEALDLCDVILSQHPGDARAVQVRASALFKLGRETEAQAALDTIKSKGSSVEMMKARMAAASEDYAQAEKLLREVIANEPTNFAAITLAVRVLAKVGRTDDALALLADVESKTDDPAAKRLIGAQRVALTTTDPDERRKKLFALIDQIEDPVQRAGEYFNYYYSAKNYEKATEYANQLEAARPDDPQVLEIQFELALRTKQYDRGEKYASKLSELNADRAGGATYRAQLKMQQPEVEGAIESALTEFRAAERALPTNSNLKVQIAQTLWMAQQYDAAIEVIKQAIDLDPTNFQANKLAYQFLESLGREEEGMQYIQQAAKLRPDDEFVKERQDEIAEARDPAAGIAKREKRRKEAPDDVENIVKLGRLYMRTRDYDTAEKRLLEAAGIAPNNRKMAVLATELYKRMDKREAGEKLLAQYIDNRDRLTKVNSVLLLATFRESFGDRDGVLAAFDQAAKLADEMAEDHSQRGRRGRIEVLRDKASYFARVGDPKSMIATLQKVLPLYTDDEADVEQAMTVRMMIIQGLLATATLDDVDAAIADFRKDFPNDNRWMMAAAEVAMRRGQWEAAVDSLNHILEIDPNQKWALWTRGRANIQLRDYDAAKTDLLKVKELAPRDFGMQHRVLLARLYVILEQYELAEAELRSLIRDVAASDPRAHQQYALMLISLLRNTGQAERAQEFVGQLAARYPKSPFWPSQLGELLMQRKEYSAAVQPFARAVKLSNSKVPQYIAQWIDALNQSHRSSEAIAAIGRLDGAVMTAQVLTYAAAAYREAGNETAARESLLRALRMASQDSIAGVSYVGGRLVKLLGRSPAREMISAEIARPDVDGQSASRLRWFLASDVVSSDDTDRMDEAIKTIDELIANASDGSPLLLQSLQLKAQAFEQTKQLDQAVACYEQILKMAPDNAMVLNNAAFLLAQTGKSEQAIKYAERAHTDLPNDANILDTLGWAYYKAQQPARAEAVFLEALSYNPKSLPVLFHLGQVYQDSNRNIEARRYYERLIDGAKQDSQTNSEYYIKAQEAMKSL